MLIGRKEYIKMLDDSLGKGMAKVIVTRYGE